MPVGMCSSSATTTGFWPLAAGYSNSHHHCLPMTLTGTALVGAASVLKMRLMVGTAIPMRITAGTTVQAISGPRLPWI